MALMLSSPTVRAEQQRVITITFISSGPGTQNAQTSAVEAVRGNAAPSSIRVGHIEGHNKRLENSKLKDIPCTRGQAQEAECRYELRLKRSTHYTLHLRASMEMTERNEHFNYSAGIHALKTPVAFHQVLIRYACGEASLVSIDGIPTPSNTKITRVYLQEKEAAFGQKHSVELMTSNGAVVYAICTMRDLPDEGRACITEDKACPSAKKPEPSPSINPSPQPTPITPPSIQPARTDGPS